MKNKFSNIKPYFDPEHSKSNIRKVKTTKVSEEIIKNAVRIIKEAKEIREENRNLNAAIYS